MNLLPPGITDRGATAPCDAASYLQEIEDIVIFKTCANPSALVGRRTKTRLSTDHLYPRDGSAPDALKRSPLEDARS